MKVLQINTTINSGSTGRIVEEIGKLLISQRHNSFIAYGRKDRPSDSQKIKVGNKLGQAIHLINTRMFDRHGLSSFFATEKLITKIKKINPDIIHLHNLHGYYINYPILFKYLKGNGKPIVWTLHDCWAFTGHCSHFERIECYKWKKECCECPLKTSYPSSLFLDGSKNNYYKKKIIFHLTENIHLVTPSVWLANHLKYSFLKGKPINVINNGINLNNFKVSELSRAELLRKYKLPDKKILLGIANTWKGKKSFCDFIKLGNKIDENYQIVLVGLSDKVIKTLPHNITGKKRTENTGELVEFYNLADIFINLTYADTIPTTNIEALACGIPVITYNTGGSPETIDENTGIVIEKGDTEELLKAVEKVISKGKEKYSKKCRERAEKYFNKDIQFQKYINLYERLIENS